MSSQTFLYKLLMIAALLILANGNFRRISRHRDIDCRRYIYHPTCRGVAAKRAVRLETTDIDDVISPEQRLHLEEIILKSVLPKWDEEAEEEEEEEEDVPSTGPDLDSLLEQVADLTPTSYTGRWSRQPSRKSATLLRMLFSARELDNRLPTSA